MQAKRSAGKALKKAFRQEDLFEGIEPQFAKVSLLMNPARLEIYLYLLANPCHHLRGISRALELSAPTISWHLNKLHHSGYIEASKSGSKNIFWVTGMIDQGDIERFAAINIPKLVQILKFAVNAGDGFREKDIVKTGADDQQLVNIRLKKLVDIELLRREGTGIQTTYFLSDNVRQMNLRYAAKIQHMSSSLITVFGADGLRPKLIRKRGHKLTVELTLPEGNRTLTMDCNPMKPFLRRVK